jgi:4-hydroxy-tetrahydrodipicolinate synthase
MTIDATALRGAAFAALATPCLPDGSLDVAGLSRLLQRVVDGGAAGISPAGSTGEGAMLSSAARIALTAQVRRLVPDGMPVISGLPLTTLAEGRAELGALADAGATAALVAPPSYYPLSDQAVLGLYETLAAVTPLPLVLYNIPVFTKVRLSPSVVGSLAAHPAIIAIKDSSRDMEYQQQVIMAAAGQDFAVLTGTDTLLVASLTMGAAGTIAGSVNLVPELASGICRACGAGDLAAANELQERLSRIVAVCRPGLFPAGWKAALELAGVCSRTMAGLGTPLSDPECAALGEALAAAGFAVSASAP